MFQGTLLHTLPSWYRGGIELYPNIEERFTILYPEEYNKERNKERFTILYPEEHNEEHNEEHKVQITFFK